MMESAGVVDQKFSVDETDPENDRPLRLPADENMHMMMEDEDSIDDEKAVPQDTSSEHVLRKLQSCAERCGEIMGSGMNYVKAESAAEQRPAVPRAAGDAPI